MESRNFLLLLPQLPPLSPPNPTTHFSPCVVTPAFFRFLAIQHYYLLHTPLARNLSPLSSNGGHITMMISANRLLLRRLSAAPTLRRIFRRSQFPQSRVVHLNELFSSTCAQINLQGGDEEYPSTHFNITAGIVEDAIAKHDVAPPLEVHPGISPEKVIRTGTMGWIE